MRELLAALKSRRDGLMDAAAVADGEERRVILARLEGVEAADMDVRRAAREGRLGWGAWMS